MKKTNKMIWLAALALTAAAGLVACGGSDTPTDSGDTPTSSKAPASSKHTHKYGEAEIVKPATCSEEGEKKQTCAECGDVKTSKISKLAHTWVDVEEGSHPATCTEGGVQNQKCSVCNTTQVVESEALGHDYGETVWDKAATCTEAGEGHQDCSRCDSVNTVTQEALGHNVVCEDDGTPAPEGKAKVRLYNCENGCGQTYFGFEASEVTAASKEHLVIGEDGGARFWGRPIGNDVELDEEGSPSEDAHEAVFNPEQSGDYFEYVFDLTEEQAKSLPAARLFCTAKAAQWMSNNRMDFWACRSGDTDWTRGLYVETTENHTAGDPIDDYRYILYVDDKVQEFDGTAVAAKSNSTKAGYELPYTFKLHAGTNKIRLVMAGGYRSTFYNFTFRAVEAPAEDPVDPTPAKTYEYLAADLVSGQKTPATSGQGSSEKNTRLGKGSIFDDVWNIEGVEAGKYDVYLQARASQGNASAGYWNSATAIANGDKASNNGSTEALQNDYKYKVKVDDGEYVNLGASEDNYAAAGLNENTPEWTTKALAQIDIAAGAKTLTVHNMDNGYSIWVYGIRLVKVA
ncbi:MAG: hypothetical protein MJ238_05180 [Bacilli bacterium]|nr:hypothetical protein [Bacilli bacterium]